MTESNLKFNLGKKIKSLRECGNLTQEQLAEKIELERDTISKIENGKRFPSCKTLEKIAQVFNIKYSDLFNFNDFDNTVDYNKAINIETLDLKEKDTEFILDFIRLYKEKIIKN